MSGLSNDLFVVTVMAYAIGMVAFAFDLAFRRTPTRVIRAAVTLPVEQTAEQKVLVGAGASPAVPLAPPAPPGPPGTTSVEVSLEPERGYGRAGRIAVGATIFGWLAHLATIVTRGFAAHRVPWGNMYEFSTVVAFIVVSAFLVLLARQKVRWLGVFVLVPVVLYLGLAGTVLYVKAGPLVPALNSYWLKIHVVAAMSATAMFFVSGIVALLYLAKVRRPAGALLSRLPDAASLDRLTYGLVAFAFPIWTFAIMAGAIWAEAAWGRYWGWDPKETWSFITWVIYAAYLHSRATAGWKGKRAAWFAVAAFSALIINYYVVNTFIVGLHSYAGIK
ncbi:MAG TPA: c-type cytochrome biogenesis protein CcsB [Frankiaceae bacterium]|jgi:cytochrome c-type biogenesis protein CcsB|nr:c-type cytochrome biogenesis protein CcsB [Frankiaceae bacterium]